MIFRIFKKDWKLLWPLVPLIAFVHATLAALWWFKDRDMLPDYLGTLPNLFQLIALLGTAILSISAILVDPIPGDRDDWLTRPIRHIDLLAAKFLFVLLAVLAPVFLISACEALSDGFTLVASITTAFGHVVALFVWVCLPAMILGALTGNAMEALVGIAGAVVLGVVGLVIVNVFGFRPSLTGYAGTTISGLTWWTDIVFVGVIIPTAMIILFLQYFRRYTVISRLLAVPLFLLALFAQDLLPWNVAFSAQQRLTSSNSKGDSVAISYDPKLKGSSRTAQDAGIFLAAGVRGSASLINLPIRVNGVSAGDVLLADRAEIRLIVDGKMIYHQDSAVSSYPANVKSETQLRQNGISGEPLHGYQAILLPIPISDSVRSRELTLEIDYSLSLFHKDATATFNALNDNKHLADIGWCRTKVDDDGDEIIVQCVQSGRVPICGSAVLENPATNRRNPETFVCAPDYNPFAFNLEPGLTRFGLSIKFKDVGNTENYPVSESQLASARVNLATYQATAHFTRQVVISNIRLSDWEAPAATTSTAPLQ